MDLGTGGWQIEKARNGLATALWDGRALHSRFDPVREAEKAAAAVPAEADIVVLAGFGLGYVAESLVRRSPKRRLIIAEANPEIPDRAVKARDLSALLNHPSVTLLVGGMPGDVRSLLTGGPAGSSIHFLPWKPSIDAAPEWYRELKECVDEHARRLAVNARTLERFGTLWVRNLAANAALISRGLSLQDWEGFFHDCPGMVLAGGPSLETVLPHLRELAQRHLMVAVDTALPAVVRAGVSPDVVVAVDPQYWNTRHLDRCGEGAGPAVILAESATHPAVFRKLKGRPWLTRSRFPMGTILEDAGGIRGELKAGGSVATAAWDLIRHLGCSSMTAAGLDLGFPSGRTHYSGSLARELPHYGSNRMNSAQNGVFQSLSSAGAYWAVAVSGNPILTDRRMDVYHAWFTESLSGLEGRSPAVVGDKGRYIAGMPSINIDTLLARPICRSLLDEGMERIRSTPVDPLARHRIDSAVEMLEARLGMLEEFAERGRQTAADAEASMRRGEKLDRALGVMEELDRELLAGEGLDVVSFLIQPIILELGKGGESSKANPLETSQRLYAEIADSAAFHRRQLSGKHKR